MVLDDLAWRGLLHQQTNESGLKEHLTEPRSIYCGFDPTAESLTHGNLVPIVMLARFQRAGHRVVVVMGGGTGLIGDPSGKESERPILSAEQVEKNIERQRPIFERVLDFEGPRGATIQNNATWLTKLSFIEMLRDVGKHFSVNMMIQKDSVRERLQNREQGISYTEFSYMLLQAYDFLHLYDTQGVTVQAAASDQWGNILGGVDLIRRKRQVEAFGVTAPLILRADGKKVGKSEGGGAIWLTADRTSPYAFYQFWLNAADADVPMFLKVYTLFGRDEIDRLVADHLANPATRTAHRALAQHMTRMLHGQEGLDQAESITKALFSGDVSALSQEAITDVFRSAASTRLGKSLLEGEGTLVVDLLVSAEVVKSKREARELLTANAITINGRPTGVDTRVTSDWLLYGEVALIRRGKKTWHVARFQ
jgi:tyrosyl-tRNA synthetase